MSNLKALLSHYAMNQESAEANYMVAREYHKIGQTAAAISFYLRAAERTEEKTLAYECMLLVGFCFDAQKNRANTVRGAYKHAIMIDPTRPEAYYALSSFNYFNNWHIEAYTVAEQGLNFANFDSPPIRIQTGCPLKTSLKCIKAFSGWWWGKVEESRSMLIDLKLNHQNELTPILSNTLDRLIVEYGAKLPANKVNIDKIDIVLQGKYTKDTDSIINAYSKLPFVNKVIVSCWEDDLPPMSFHAENVQFVLNQKPSSYGTDNRNLQIISSRNGLAKVTTKYAAKMRTDQEYDAQSMQNMYNFFSENYDGRIFVPGMYPNLIFHPRDHLFWGETKNLVDLFSVPLEQNGFSDKMNVGKDQLAKYYKYFTRAETYICAHYAALKDERVVPMILNQSEYFYDEAKKWGEAYALSKELCPKLFKSFPKEGVDLKWHSKKLENYPYEEQKKYYNECWHEDGV